MPDIKRKPSMTMPKVKKSGFVPKTAEGILRRRHEDVDQKRRPDARDPVQYATGRVEAYGSAGMTHAADAGVGGAARRIKREVKKLGKKDTEPKKETGTEPEVKPHASDTPRGGVSGQTGDARDGVPQGNAMKTARDMPKGYTADGSGPARPFGHGTESSGQTAMPSARQLGRWKAARDAARKKQESIRAAKSADAREDSIAGRLSDTNIREQTGGAPDAIYGRMEGTPHGARTPAPKERVVPRNSAKKPAKPAFALKDRAAAAEEGRQALTPAQRAKRAGTRKLQRQMAREKARKAADMAVQAAKRTVEAIKAAARAAGKVGAIIGIAGNLLILLVTITVVGAIAASPFGILFSNEAPTSDSVPVSAAIARINYDFNAMLEELQAADDYSEITLEGTTADWTDVLAVFASKVAGSEGPDAVDVVTMDADRVSRLKVTFWDMTEVTAEEEIIVHEDTDPDDGEDDSWIEKQLHITLTPKTAAEMPDVYSFTVFQTEAMNELLAERAMLAELVGNLAAITAEASEAVSRLPDDLSPERRAIVETACSLVGKVTYFWGGKSLVLGWDSRWGAPQLVTAAGNSTSGTYRPYGLDCSGFVDWVFYNATDGAYYPGHGGGARMQHSYCNPISWKEAMPGDLVFYPDDEHVGIVAGRDDDGELLIVHCASSANGTVITGKSGFASIGRPKFYQGS